MKDYFSHDYNARNDKKLVRAFMKFGLEAIGAYWCIVEMLYEEGGYLPLLEYERITFELRTNEKLLNYLIYESELFVNDTINFWSETAIERLKLRSEKSDKARKSIESRWNKRKTDTNVLQTNDERNTIKENKVKENKVKKKLSIEEKDAFIAKIQGEFYHSLTPYFGIYPKDEIDKFYNYWSESNTALTKIKWQMEPTWDLHRRLERWMKNNKEFNTKFTKPNNQQPNGQKKLSY